MRHGAIRQANMASPRRRKRFAEQHDATGNSSRRYFGIIIKTMVRGKRNDSKKLIASEADPTKLPTETVRDTTTEDFVADPVELMVEPNGSKRRKQAAAAAHSGPTRRRPKLKLEEIRPDVPPSSSMQPDPIGSVRSIPTPSSPATTVPVPDHATSLSNATAMTTSSVGRSILHIKHKTGEVLGTYKSCYAAAKSVGISRHIVDSLVKGIYKANHHKGSSFRYATSNEEASTVGSRSIKSDIEQIDVATGNVIATFRSILAASKETGVGRKDISSMVKGELDSKNGWTFRLVTDNKISPDVVKSEPPDSVNDLDLPKETADESGDDDEPESSNCEMIVITISENGSLGIVARRTQAPGFVLSMVSLANGDAADDMNLQIDSFIGTDSIAEKSGMQVGDFLFLSYISPLPFGLREELICGEYKSVSYYIKRKPRPTTFYVARLKSIVIPSISLKATKALSLDTEEELVEELDPLKEVSDEDESCKYAYHPINITESGPLGIKAKRRKNLPKGYASIPFFTKLDSDYPPGSFQVEYLIGADCLARRIGLMDGDFLVCPCAGYTPAMFNFQEAFFLDTYDGVLDTIEKGSRPRTLYAIRLKSKDKANTSKKNFHQLDVKEEERSAELVNDSKPDAEGIDLDDDKPKKGKKRQRGEMRLENSSESGAQIAKNSTEDSVSSKTRGRARGNASSSKRKNEIGVLDQFVESAMKLKAPEPGSEDDELVNEVVDESGEDDESSNFEVHEVTVTKDGSIGIMARRTRAPDAIVSLFDLFDGGSDEEMHLCIDSFIGRNSIAEKAGMQVGDYLFVSYTNPGPFGMSEELVYGTYNSVVYYIRRKPRPTTFYAVRLKSNIPLSLSVKATESISSDANNELVEDMDPMNGMGGKDKLSDYSYHPIVLTKWGSLGIKAKKRKNLPKGYETIPYFREMGGFNPFRPRPESFQVESLIGTNCLASKFGIQAGDYLVRPCSGYTPAKFNYQEAFYTNTYDGVLDAIEKRTRPITLYAIRLKTTNKPSKRKGRVVKN
jgi:hypothetical protein